MQYKFDDVNLMIEDGKQEEKKWPNNNRIPSYSQQKEL